MVGVVATVVAATVDLGAVATAGVVVLTVVLVLARGRRTVGVGTTSQGGGSSHA